jgi:putative transposase
MQTKQPIEKGNYYHIYNRGNNRSDIFFEKDNYSYFLKLYDKYISPVAETFAWCLLKNHFHLLVRIKNDDEINAEQLSYSTTEKPKTINPSRQFSHLFNAYTQAINKKYNRTGSLFENTFERKLVSSEKYFQQLIFYIHNNPVHHGLVDNLVEYHWSSYQSVVSEKETKLKRKEVIEAFDDKQNFIFYHNQNHNLKDIKSLVIE